MTARPRSGSALVPTPRRLRSEKDFEQCVHDAWRKLVGPLYYHTHRSEHSEAGFLDVLGIEPERHHPPRVLVAELKMGKESLTRYQPTESQERWLAAWARVPWAERYLWYPRHWHEGIIADVFLERFYCAHLATRWVGAARVCDRCGGVLYEPE